MKKLQPAVQSQMGSNTEMYSEEFQHNDNQDNFAVEEVYI